MKRHLKIKEKTFKLTTLGFTLIELLAVIVVLAIIMLIAAPLIFNVIEDAKQEAAKRSAVNYNKALELSLTNSILSGNNVMDGIYTLDNNGNIINPMSLEVDVKGNKAAEGFICILNRDIKSYSLKVGEYYITSYDGQNQEITSSVIRPECDNVEEIQISLNHNTCAKNKVITINYPSINNANIMNQYSFDNVNWENYSDSIVMNSNGTIYARVYDGANIIKASSIIVQKIDNDKVSTDKPTLTLSTTNPRSSIIASISQIDNCGLDESTIEYGISEDNIEYKWQKNNVFEKLKSGTTYYIKTRANDIASNGVVESDYSNITTSDFEAIKIEQDISEWSPSKTITISNVKENMIVEYSIGDTEQWVKYSAPFIISDNTTIYARIYDGEIYSKYYTYKVTKIAKNTYLADVVEIGDYINYDAGTWDTTTALPTSNGKYGGYTKGTNRSTSVTCTNGYPNYSNGWRVVSKEGSGENGIVTLIHAGTPECLYYSSGNENMIKQAQSEILKYINSNYAESASFLTYDMLVKYHKIVKGSEIVDDTNKLFNIGGFYWLFSMPYEINPWNEYDQLPYVGWPQNGTPYLYYNKNYSLGIRPVIRLKRGVQISSGSGSKESSYNLIPIEENSNYLVDVVKVGDYVNYDAGNWDTTTTIPTSNGKYGGYTKGTNKSTSVTCKNGYPNKSNGWRVVAKEGSGISGRVVLIHAGTPECLYFSSNNKNAILTSAMERLNYMNPIYANRVEILSQDKLFEFYGSSINDSAPVNDANKLFNIGGFYWILSQPNDKTDRLPYVGWPQNGIPYYYTNNNFSSGIRPIAYLNNGIKTISGEGTSTSPYRIK